MSKKNPKQKIIDLKQLGYVRKLIDKTINDMNPMKKKLINKYIKELKLDLELDKSEVITAFYSDYEPKYYKRLGSLYHVANVKTNPNTGAYSVDWDENLDGFEHRVDNEYIFENSFMDGWHGGAKEGVDLLGRSHPEPGVPYYMTGKGFFRWGYKAYQSDSPYEEMIKRMNTTINNMQTQMQDEYDKNMLEKFEQINIAISKAYLKGE